MGRWGVGISSSDEYADVKDEFFHRFYQGDTINEIEKYFIKHFTQQGIDESNSIWYEIYFALADCEWKCGMLSDWLLLKVEYIITNKLSLYDFSERLADASTVKAWSMTLDKFLTKIKTKNIKPYKQVIKKPYKPPFEAGDVFVYKVGDLYRLGIIIHRRQFGDGRDKFCFEYLTAIAKLESITVPKLIEIKNSQCHFNAPFPIFNMPPKNKITIIGNIASELKTKFVFENGKVIGGNSQFWNRFGLKEKFEVPFDSTQSNMLVSDLF